MCMVCVRACIVGLEFGLGFRVQGLGFRVWCFEFSVEVCLEFWFRV